MLSSTEVLPELEGITLARRSTTNPQLEEVKNLREYQTSRLTRSISGIDCTLLRLRRNHSGDSVEFTFRAVDPSSESYEAALYRSEGVIFERIVGEPPPKKGQTFPIVVVLSAFLLGALMIWLISTGRLQSTSGEKLTRIKLAGCDLRVVSLFDVYGRDFYSPWRIKHRVFDVGTEDCVIQSEKMNLASPVTVKPGEALERESISESAPKLVDIEISVGATRNSLTKTTVPLYVER